MTDITDLSDHDTMELGTDNEEVRASMMYERAVQDTKEKVEGTRFHDSGMRIPGAQKGRNDNYEKRIRR